jgi:SAM-dependent methyltransferase
MSNISGPAERNKGPILEVLKRVLPARGLVLEVASGTGQHVVHFAKALPQLTWQPSDRDPEDLARSLKQQALKNVRAPLALDVLAPWPIDTADAVVCSNMIHIAPWEAGLALIAGAARTGAKLLFLYGPYRRRNRPTAPSNEAFDADLRARDPRWGLRELETVVETAERCGFRLDEVVEMPANNLSVVLRSG